MLRLVPDYIKTKKLCKNAVKTLSFVIDKFLIDMKLK